VSSMGDEDSWTNGPTTTMEEVRISPPYDRSFEQLYLSYHFTLFVRVLAPAFGLTASVLAGSEVLRLKREGCFRKAWITGTICALEAPVLFIVALILALGHFGPMALDFVYHRALQDLFIGFSVSTTLLFSFFLAEESRCIIRSLPRRSFWEVYRWGLAACLCLLLSYIALPVSMVFLKDAWRILIAVNFASTFVLQCTIAAFWFTQSWALRTHFNRFLTETSSATRSQATIKKLTYYMTMGSVVMALCSLSFVLGALPYLSGGVVVYGTGAFYACILAFIYSRIGFSYAQIMAIRPNAQPRNRVQPLTHRDNDSNIFTKFARLFYSTGNREIDTVNFTGRRHSNQRSDSSPRATAVTTSTSSSASFEDVAFYDRNFVLFGGSVPRGRS